MASQDNPHSNGYYVMLVLAVVIGVVLGIGIFIWISMNSTGRTRIPIFLLALPTILLVGLVKIIDRALVNRRQSLPEHQNTAQTATNLYGPAGGRSGALRTVSAACVRVRTGPATRVRLRGPAVLARLRADSAGQRAGKRSGPRRAGLRLLQHRRLRPGASDRPTDARRTERLVQRIARRLTPPDPAEIVPRIRVGAAR